MVIVRKSQWIMWMGTFILNGKLMGTKTWEILDHLLEMWKNLPEISEWKSHRDRTWKSWGWEGDDFFLLTGNFTSWGSPGIVTTVGAAFSKSENWMIHRSMIYRSFHSDFPSPWKVSRGSLDLYNYIYIYTSSHTPFIVNIPERNGRLAGDETIFATTDWSVSY